MQDTDAPIFNSHTSVPATEPGFLDGWTIAVKDNIDVAGLPTTGGTKYLRDNVAAVDADVVARLRRQGACIVGKTNMHELGHGITGVNPTYGTTVHPDNPEYTVGGSSGGSALAVAGGHARAALGTDTGGSVRIPAAFTGLVGFRPSTGRYPSSGVIHISPTRDTVGVIARDVRDVRTLDRALSGRNTAPLGKSVQNVGVLAESRNALSPPIRDLFDVAVASVRASGVEVLEIESSREPERCFDLGLVILGFETLAAIGDYVAPRYGKDAMYELIAESESEDVHAILAAAAESPIERSEYEAAQAELQAIRARFVAQMAVAGIEAIMYPTVAAEPPLARPSLSIDDLVVQLRTMVRNCTPATLFGTPAITLPMGRSAVTALPSGFALEHVDNEDDALLVLAQRIESVTGGTK